MIQRTRNGDELSRVNFLNIEWVVVRVEQLEPVLKRVALPHLLTPNLFDYKVAGFGGLYSLDGVVRSEVRESVTWGPGISRVEFQPARVLQLVGESVDRPRVGVALSERLIGPELAGLRPALNLFFQDIVRVRVGKDERVLRAVTEALTLFPENPELVTSLPGSQPTGKVAHISLHHRVRDSLHLRIVEVGKVFRGVSQVEGLTVIQGIGVVLIVVQELHGGIALFLAHSCFIKQNIEGVLQIVFN